MYKQNLNKMKKIFGLVAVAAIAALNVVVSNNNKEAELSDLSLENVEASAYTEIIYLPYLDTHYRCCYIDILEGCHLYWGRYDSCPDWACQE